MPAPRLDIASFLCNKQSAAVGGVGVDVCKTVSSRQGASGPIHPPDPDRGGDAYFEKRVSFTEAALLLGRTVESLSRDHWLQPLVGCFTLPSRRPQPPPARPGFLGAVAVGSRPGTAIGCWAWGRVFWAFIHSRDTYPGFPSSMIVEGPDLDLMVTQGLAAPLFFFCQ